MNPHVIKPLTPETYPAWLALAQKAGFTFERHIGKSKTVVRKTIQPASG